MSTLSSVREFARPATLSLSFGRAVALLAGGVVVGIEHAMSRVELARSRRQLAQLDERLLRDIGLTRLDAAVESSKHFWQP